MQNHYDDTIIDVRHSSFRKIYLSLYHIYPTPPLGQDMTHGQFFLSGV